MMSWFNKKISKQEEEYQVSKKFQENFMEQMRFIAECKKNSIDRALQKSKINTDPLLIEGDTLIRKLDTQLESLRINKRKREATKQRLKNPQSIYLRKKS